MEMIFYLNYAALFYMVGLRLFKLGKLHKLVTPTDLIAYRAGGFERVLKVVLGVMIAYAVVLYTGII